MAALAACAAAVVVAPTLVPTVAWAQTAGPARSGGYPRGVTGQGRGPMGYASPASASTASPVDPGGSLQDFLFGARTAERRAMPPVARFRADDGDSFVLERASGAALLKFEDSPEVWALTPTSGPRGDTIFKNDVGDPILRMTRLGGMTLFTDERPDGMAVSMAGPAGSLRPPSSIGPNALFQALAASSVRASRAAQHLISFVVAPDVTPKTDWLFADAAIVTAEAFVRLAGQGIEGRQQAGRYGKVEFLLGGQVQAQVTGGVVHITVTPGKGVAGRPSSQRIYLLLRRR